MDDIDGDVMEEAFINNDHNLQSIGALKYNDSPSSSKMVLEKTSATTTSPEKNKDKSLPDKITVTKLSDLNEPLMFSIPIPNDFGFETFFGELNVELSRNANSYTQSKLLHLTHIAKPHCTLVDISPTNYSIEPTNPNLWSMYFDRSKSKYGVVVGCLLIDPHGNQTIVSYLTESKCLDNMVEYEDLLQCLRKSIDLNIKCIEVFGDFEVVIK